MKQLDFFCRPSLYHSLIAQMIQVISFHGTLRFLVGCQMNRIVVILLLILVTCTRILDPRYISLNHLNFSIHEFSMRVTGRASIWQEGASVSPEKLNSQLDKFIYWWHCPENWYFLLCPPPPSPVPDFWVHQWWGLQFTSIIIDIGDFRGFFLINLVWHLISLINPWDINALVIIEILGRNTLYGNKNIFENPQNNAIL